MFQIYDFAAMKDLAGNPVSATVADYPPQTIDMVAKGIIKIGSETNCPVLEWKIRQGKDRVTNATMDVSSYFSITQAGVVTMQNHFALLP